MKSAVEKRFNKQDKYLSIIFSDYRLRLKSQIKIKMYKLDEANIVVVSWQQGICFWYGKKAENDVIFYF